MPPDVWARRALGHHRDFADFDMPGWLAFCDGAERAGLILAAVASSLPKVRNWLETQVAASLAVVREIYGDETMTFLMLRGYEQLRSKHRAYMAGLHDH
jgi:hypothetical protein